MDYARRSTDGWGESLEPELPHLWLYIRTLEGQRSATLLRDLEDIFWRYSLIIHFLRRVCMVIMVLEDKRQKATNQIPRSQVNGQLFCLHRKQTWEPPDPRRERWWVLNYRRSKIFHLRTSHGFKRQDWSFCHWNFPRLRIPKHVRACSPRDFLWPASAPYHGDRSCGPYRSHQDCEYDMSSQSSTRVAEACVICLRTHREIEEYDNAIGAISLWATARQ